jgi:5-oxoprolinase (ATP-hydrolysing) subunit A
MDIKMTPVEFNDELKNETPRLIDINCDMGEGMPFDAALMPYISAANIACGFHAGDENTMRQTVSAAMQYQVKIGAHISFADRENFGRKSFDLPAAAIRDLVQEQLGLLRQIAGQQGARLIHVKPHGALYNQSAQDQQLAHTIAAAVKAFDPALVIYGLSGSFSVSEARALGLTTASEVFADRSYQDDGSLTPRGEPGALLHDPQQAVQQVLHMLHNQSVRTVTGKCIPLNAETICIHGDGSQPLEFAKALVASFEKDHIHLAKNNLTSS